MKENKSYFYLFVWIVSLLSIGSLIGSFTKTGINTWYSTLNLAPLTPPHYVFPVVWTVLYVVLASCGWFIWRASLFERLWLIKSLYAVQLLLNWCWTPLFFLYHLTGISLALLVVMNIAVVMVIYLSCAKIRLVSLLLAPYLLWILFAAYLNFYVWRHN